MSNEYQTLFPHPCEPGGIITIEGHKTWDCVVPCTVIGFMLDSGIPVIKDADGPRVVSGELIPQGQLRTLGRAGQTPLEVMTLGEYAQVSPRAMAGRKIAHCHYTSTELILIDGEKNYTKLVPCEAQYDEPTRFEWEPLTMSDLREFGLLSEEDWERYGRQQKARHAETARRRGKQALVKALRILGPTEVKIAAMEAGV